ncbi:hypothetical protein ACL07V_34525 [Streptomyces sp. MB22_4]|uniref:hypothetical protein n=1 Tax=Streptomyces sp. MB22_4 TaxID=3383120 RepID=UPI0039A2698D
MSNTTATTDFDARFDSFDIEDLGVLEVTEGAALPEMGALERQRRVLLVLVLLVVLSCCC